MKAQRFAILVSLINLVVLVFLLLSRTDTVVAKEQVPVLRGRALEILDDQGRVRASIKVQPAETFKPTGRKYPETVMLRLIDPHGRPEVKIGASVEGGGLSLVGDSDSTQAHLQADTAGSWLRLTSEAGRERLIEP